MEPIKATVIISVYKKLDYLLLILDFLEKQSFKNFEVIVAEDDDSLIFDTNRYSFKVKHLQQKDEGFRKARILNKAIVKSEAENLIFLDGDCVPHFKLVEEYVGILHSFDWACGRRVFLHEKLTGRILHKGTISLFELIVFPTRNIKEAIYLSFKNPLRSKSKKLKGCNWAIRKQNLLEINGFDMDYKVPSNGEDSDMEERFKMQKWKGINMCNKCVTYHLHHEKNYNSINFKNNKKMMLEKLKSNTSWRENGITALT